MNPNTESQINVRFVSKIEKPAEEDQERVHSQAPLWMLPDIPILVPTVLGRAGLSQIVLHLLGKSDSTKSTEESELLQDSESLIKNESGHRQFDFLIDQQLLRTSIQDYLTTHQLSTENQLVIEVIESMGKPSRQPPVPLDDWLLSVDSTSTMFVTGCANGMAKLWNRNGSCLATLKGHQAQINAVRCYEKGGVMHVWTASSDQHVYGWTIENPESASHEQEIACRLDFQGHADSVSALAVDPTHAFLATGGWDAAVKLWSADFSTDNEYTHTIVSDDSNRDMKKRKVDASVPVRESITGLLGHSGAITCLQYPNRANLYTGSMDHTVREWDVETRSNTGVIGCDAIAMALAHRSLGSALVAAGYTDRLIRIWDPRSSTVAIQRKLQGHQGWVRGVQWAPVSTGNEHQLASASHDGMIKIWDLRANGSLYTIRPSAPGKTEQPQQRTPGKLFCLDWTEDGLIAAGGEEEHLLLYRYASGSENTTESVGR